MNTMNMPGFTADASLYKSSRHYHAMVIGSADSSRVVVQLRLQSDHPFFASQSVFAVALAVTLSVVISVTCAWGFGLRSQRVIRIGCGEEQNPAITSPPSAFVNSED